MREENLQYKVTFKTLSEGDGTQKVVQSVRDLTREKERLNALEQPEKTRVVAAGEYDLARSIEETATATKKATFQTNENSFAKIKAKQAAQQLVDELKLEEMAKKKAAAASGTAAKGQRDLGAATLEVSRAFEDAQYGMRGMLNNLPVLIGMLGGSAGLAGAVSIGAVAISIFAGKLEALEKAAKDSGEAAAEMKQKLIELAAAQAAQELDLYLSRLEQAEQITKNIADAEVRRIALASEQAAANRRVEASQDLLTGAALEYLSAIGGIEAVEQRRALKQREADREQANQLDAQNVRIEQARQSYENLNAEIDRMKAKLAEATAARDSLEVQRANLTKQIEINQRAGNAGEAQNLSVELQPVLAKLAEVERQLVSLPKQIDGLVAEAWAQAGMIDETLASARSQIEAINTEFANRASAEQLGAVVEDNRRITSELAGALQNFEATTPAQAQAAADLAAALADGRLTSEELGRLSNQLRILGPTFTQAVNGMTGQVDKLIAEVQALMAKQKAQDQVIEGLKNRR